MSVNHFPYLPVVMNLENNPCIHCRDGDPDRHQNFIVCSLVRCQPFLKISCKSVGKFLREVAKRQTVRQANNDENITSLAEANILIYR